MDGFCNWYGQCWLHVVEFLAGDGGQVAKGRELNKRVSSSLNASRFLATVGWSIYPLSYFFGYLFSIVVDNVFNLAYNLADTPYKIWFVAAVWQIPDYILQRAKWWVTLGIVLNLQPSAVFGSWQAGLTELLYTSC